MAKDNVRRSIRDGLIEFAEVFLRSPAGRRLISIRMLPELRGRIITMHCGEIKPLTPELSLLNMFEAKDSF